MKKNSMIVALLIILVCAVALFLAAVGKRPKRALSFEGADVSAIREEINLIPEKNQLIANAATREEAEKIAELYGITLVEYSGKVAVYDTKQSPQELIKLGEERGYPPLSINYSYSLWEG